MEAKSQESKEPCKGEGESIDELEKKVNDVLIKKAKGTLLFSGQ